MQEVHRTALDHFSLAALGADVVMVMMMVRLAGDAKFAATIAESRFFDQMFFFQQVQIAIYRIEAQSRKLLFHALQQLFGADVAIFFQEDFDDRATFARQFKTLVAQAFQELLARACRVALMVMIVCIVMIVMVHMQLPFPSLPHYSIYEGVFILELSQHSATPAGNTRPLGAFYLFFFMAFGALYPMLPLFLQSHNLTGTQIGWVMTTGTIVTVLFQPIWGMICDRFHIQRQVLAVTLFVAAGLSLCFPLLHTYALFLLVFGGMALCHSTGVPIIDSISLSYVQKHGGDYGSLRLFGSIGFAVASWIAGKVSDLTSLSSIFYIYAFGMLACVITTRFVPNEASSISFDLKKGLGTLLRLPRFLVFLFGTFLVFGTIQANNSYYGIFYQTIGGTITGVGLSFLIAAGTEAPVMRFAGKVIARIGVNGALVLSAAISTLRWLYYGMAPPSGWVVALLFVQGLSVGLYLPAAATFVRETAPAEIRTTAMGLYSAIGNGLGSMVCTMIGGMLLDRLGIFNTYKIFGMLSLIGVAAMILIRFLPHQIGKK